MLALMVKKWGVVEAVVGVIVGAVVFGFGRPILVHTGSSGRSYL
jgi:hypothetical protein